MRQPRVIIWDELVKMGSFQLADSPCHYRIGKVSTDPEKYGLYKLCKESLEYSADVERTVYSIRLRHEHDGLTYYKEIDYREIVTHEK